MSAPARPPASQPPTDTTTQLVVQVQRDCDPPRGSVRDRDSTEHRFIGWLGLMRVLEERMRADRPPAAHPDQTGAGMSTTPSTPVEPIALQADEGEALWFLGTLATIKASADTTRGRVAVIEHLAPRGAGSPLHVHRNEDEWFYVVEGELTIWVDGQTIVAAAGAFVYGPRDVPHTFIVSSEQARFLLVLEPGGFERFVRATAEPAARREIPPPSTTPPDMGALLARAAEHGVEILGPPGIPA